MTGRLFAAVDVGTGSARAAIFDASGALLAHAGRPIAMRGDPGGAAEQSSEGIWAAICAALRDARAQAGAAPEDIAGLGFCATCSLALRDASGAPVGAGEDGDPAWDVIAWCDHRAGAEADAAQAAAARLHAEGRGPAPEAAGVASPEMQLPKLMHLKRRRPETWARAERIFDLADLLTWRATGELRRAACALACKWGWSPETGWPLALLEALDLSDLPGRGGLPGGDAPGAADRAPAPVGACIGRLSAQAAAETGLAPGAPVAAGQVDAYSGALGLLGELSADALPRAAALIAGTSSCIMHLSRAAFPAPGLWGPYPGVVLPGWSAAEGGQSASGALLDHVLRLSGLDPQAPGLHAEVAARVQALLAAEGDGFGGEIHVLPDFNGVRSPRPDPAALGAAAGLSLERGFDAACRLWWRSAVGLALGVREVIAHMDAQGRGPERLILGGGHGRSPLLAQLYADATGLPVVLGGHCGGMLRGAALSAMAASGAAPDVAAAARATARPRPTLSPDPARAPRMARDLAAQRILAEQRAKLAAL
ncbi:FGGY-family carbohydrate kinase [Rhodovulum sp. DZ06]|uniref:FGGY-family carbohydrate kinase n=1 Tax=Rhodovulum sp. DZ06 TaxID=3425126 RepID=UPI003D33E882